MEQSVIKRRKTRGIWVGKVKIGDGAPISVQSMTKTDPADISATVKQIKELENLGCEIIRLAIPHHNAASVISLIKRKITIPIEADIHFNPKLALESIKQGVDAIRLNPGNITDKNAISEIVKASHKVHIPIRVGVNSGSISGWFKSSLRHQIAPNKRVPKTMWQAMADAALEYSKYLESLNFKDIIISLKASDVISTVNAYRYVSNLCDYPLHLGITASGPTNDATIKSSIGIGALLLEGIGDTIRVSLTGPSHEEIKVGYKILQSLGLRSQRFEIISCPTCGRCEIDIIRITQKVESILGKTLKLDSGYKNIKIGIMGCVVNGPGEAVGCDICIAGGKGFGFLFKDGKRIRKVPESRIVTELIKEIREIK
ncbi:MAG: flavodoxin-dependent (E)-4-hydroxy-3-methylbut-2-enyl-diphosphate synthase [Planctomycetota bacterium]